MGTISFFGINKQHLLVWAVTLLMGGVSFSFAQCPPKDAEITFTSIQANAEETLVFGDEDILQPCTTLKTIEKCELLIGLDFGDDFDLYSAFNSPSQQITVTLEARAYSDCNATTELILSPFPFTQTFTIKRDQPEQLYKTDITTFHTNYLIGGNPNLNPARAIKVKITSVSIPAPLTAIASSYLRLKASFTEDFKVWPDFLNQALNVITLNALSTPSASNPVTFTWTPCGYFENYQFQLLRLYNNDPANTSQSSVTSTVDWSKALSIVTESATPSLTITVAEGTGYYIWRVRPMGDFFPGGIGDVLNWGDWNSDAPADGVTLNFTDPASLPSYAFWYNQFDDDKNWIYSRTFTEGNPERGQQFRVSEQITYANGLQQVKQNQAHLTSQGKILVSQTIQDFSGRPALTTMAAPLARNFFDYEEGLCTESGDLYTASKFDNNANFDDPLPMSGTIESYYSNNNGDVTIPPSEQYPFTRTLWFRDGTNRVKEQGGVGPSHRIGSTHTVRTRYAGAAEEELIRIFGDEAPSAESVYKIINADPNNTVTASYIAKEGQTIATCLVTSGGSPLQPLPSATDPAFTVTRTIPPPLPKDDYLSSSTTLDLSNGGAIAWNYSLTPELLTSVCNSSCSSCDYKVEFWLFNISDPDDNTFPRKGPAPGDPEIIISPSGVCTTSTYTFSGSWTGLDPGTYLVERRVFTGLLNTDNIPYIEEKIQNDMDDYETGIRSNSTLQNIFAYLDLNDAEGLKLYLCSLKSLAGQPCTGTDDTYTIPATCCDIQVPVVSCNEPDPCTTMDLDANDNYDFETDLFELLHTGPNQFQHDFGSALNDYFLSHQEPFYDVPVEAQFTFTYDDACAGSYSSQKLTIAISGLDAPFQVTINDPFASGDPAFYVADAIAQEINSLFSSTHHDLAATAQSNLNGTATIYFTGFLGNAPTVLYFTIIYSYTCSFFPFVTETYFNQPDINFSPAASFPYPNGGNGAFNAMITHMINDDGFDCSQLYKCWNTLIAAYPYLAYKDPVELNGTPFTDKNPDFNLMETFLNCARADAAANCGYTGISNCPYGNCETADPLNGYGYGYLEYAYKYFHYDETNRSLPCETLIVETYTASPYVYPAAISDIASTPPWSAFASGDNCPPEPPGSSGPNTPWLDLYACANAEGNIISAGALPDACSPGNLAADPQGCTDAMITETENKCKEICDDRHDGFVTSLINLNHDNQIFVTGHDDQGDDQQLITFAQDNYTLGTTDIADIYCTANLLLEQCKTKCTLSPVDLDGDGDFDRIGSDAEIEAIKEAMTYTYELEFPSAGSCSAGFTYVSGSADAEEVIVEYLNNMLEEFRSSLSYPGTGEGGWFSLYDLFYNLNPGLTGLCGLEDQTASDPGSKVFVHPDKPSFFTVGPCGGGGIPQICNWGKFSPNETLLLCYDATTTLTPPAFFINATYLWSTGETASSALIGPFSQSTVTDPCEVVFVHITNADNPGEVVTYYYGITLNDCSAPTGDCCLYYIDGMSQADLPSKSGREALIQPGRDTARIAFPKPFSEPPLVTVDSASAPCTVDSVTATHCILRATDTLGRFAFLTITEKNIEAVEGSVSQGQFVARIAFPDTLTIVPRLTILQSDVLASAAKADTAGFLLIASEKKGLNATVGICDDLSLSGTETIPAGTTLYHVDFTFIPPVTSFLSPPIVMVPCSASVITSGFYPQNVTTTGFDIVVMNSAVSHTVCWTAESRCTTSVTLLCHDFCLDAPCDPVCIRYFPIDMPIGDAITITYITCEEMSSGYIKNDLESQIARCLQTQEAALREQYRLKCATPTDQATVSATLQYHHYTLFYYDRAGNLVKTVPPAGVRFTDAGGNTVDQRSEHNDHKLKTQYAYNSIKQLVRQETPDGGETFFVYDLKGQLRFSQNAQQRIDNVYSYTKYDQLGRIIEVGKSIENAGDFGVSSVYSSFETWAQVTVFPNAGLTNSEITFTEYSLNTGIAYNPNLYINLPQQNLQNRVSHTFTDEDGDLTTLTGQVHTWYSYDPHGNVEWLVQDIPDLGKNYIRYQYDLISGKVKEVEYNQGRVDQFFHRYKYDEDNRIVQVETSSDSVLWDRDARYGYYAHGPLKRMLLGEDKIQGIDYIYTIQGWLKGINNPALMGIGSETGNIAADAFGMTLGYYLGDFNRTGSPYNNLTATSLNGTSLFNGNISSWTSNLDYSIIPYAPNMKYTLLAGDAYQYDELNRIKNSYFHYYDGTGWQLANDEFHTAYTYDPNGNIITLNRKGHGANANAKRLDELDYRYYAGANRLEYIDDNVPQGNWTTDLDDQGAGNYTYDAIGNLTKDVKEKIKQIEWTVYGKVKRIIHFNKNDPTLNFTYDAQGNRVIKELKYPSLCAHSFTSPKPCNPNPNDVKTFYVRDASGNIMAIYEKTEEQNKYKYRLKEIPLYGSTMLGEYKPNVLVKEVAISNGNITIPTLSATNLFSRSLSKREYTVNDHLSSVRSVLSDKKFATITGGAPTDFTSEILSVSNMYAGGMLQPGRSYNSADYSWGYQGQLKVDEIAGVGKHYTAEFWEYDPLTGRRWNRDQINKPWESPYAAFANNPIWFVDPTGMDTFRIDRNQQLQIIRGGEDALFIETAVKEKEIDEERDRFILQHGTSEQIRDLQFEFAYQQYDIEGIKDIFATVMSESSENLEESEGITNVLLNRARLQGISPERFSPETFNQIGGSGIYGRLNTTYNTANQMSFEEFFAEGFERSQTVKGVLNAFSGWRSDVSGGAYFWEGVTPYSQVGNYFRTRIEVANNRTPIFQINRTLGQTHFIQYNPQHTTYRRSIWP